MLHKSPFLAVLLVSSSLFAADTPKQSKIGKLGHSIANEIRQYGHDFKQMTLAPLHWNGHQWTRFGEGAAAVGVVYAVDGPLYDAVQRNRGSFTDNFAKAITPFGARRAEWISAAMIVAGSMTHDFTMRDAGRDSLEAEIWAGGIVTPVIKRIAGRARPIQDEGSHSFHPFNKNFESFPSGHSTNAWAAATGIASHYDNWIVPTIAYSIAAGVSFSRVNDKAHFFSDVLAGALIGRAVAKSIAIGHIHGGRIAMNIRPETVNGHAALLLTFRPLR